MIDPFALVPPGTLAGFVVASMVLTVAPGPDVMFLATVSARYGSVRGAMLALGLAAGNLVHTAAAALGVTAVVVASPRAFGAVRIAGIAYLMYLAFVTFRDEGSAGGGRAQAPALSAARLFARGVLMNVMNPKVMLLFLAFFPQFVDPTRGPVAAQMLLLGAVFTAQVVVVFGGVAVLFGLAGRRLGAGGTGLTGGVFRYAVIALYLALATKLALTDLAR